MLQPVPRTVVHRFPGWELRPAERLLLVDGRPAKLGGRAYDLLVALVQRQGRVATKEELLQAVWRTTVVEENNLFVQVAALRRVLGAGVVATVSHQGYQLTVAPLDAPADLADAADVPQSDARPAVPAARRLRLFGRDADLRALQALLPTARLVTVAGTGGVGKTTLARAVAAQAAPGWRDGVHWIELAHHRPGVPLMAVLARALGAPPQEPDGGSGALMALLSQLQALVVLDNCEHLRDELRAFLPPLLRAAPGIRWLATSQVPMRLRGERVHRLQPLDLPVPGADARLASGSGALALFCDRATAADREFVLNDDDLPIAADLCVRLDGLPLALEMAAARVATLGLRGVHGQIHERLRLRGGRRGGLERHHSLLQTFDWSHGLLSAEEQRVFRRLACFVDGFTIAMAAMVCGGVVGAEPPLPPWEVTDALSALVDKSLVLRPVDGRPAGDQRLRMLESLRDYAGARLHAAGEAEAVRRLHAQAVAAAFADACDRHLHGRDSDWLARYGPERGNAAAALEGVLVQPEPELLAALVCALSLLDQVAQTHQEVVRHAVPLDVLHAALPPGRARACLHFGWSHFLDGNRELGTGLVQRALADFEALGDVAGVHAALTCLVRLFSGRPGQRQRAQALWRRLRALDETGVPLRLRLTRRGNVDFIFGEPRTVERLQQLGRLARQAGLDMLALSAGANATDELLRQGRYAEAAAMAQDLLAEASPDRRVPAMVRHNLALALVRLGRPREARAAARQVLRALPGLAPLLLDTCAMAALQEGRAEDAALMAGHSAHIKRERDRGVEPAEAALIADTLALLQARLGAAASDELMQLGAAMPVADVLALALQA